MGCTDCRFSKETIPAQLNYVYCTKFEKEMPTYSEFKKCQYEESDEYKLKMIESLTARAEAAEAALAKEGEK